MPVLYVVWVVVSVAFVAVFAVLSMYEDNKQ